MNRIEKLIYTCKDITIHNVKDGQIIWMSLGETCNMKAGKTISASLISDECSKENPYPCYGGNDIRGYVSSYNQTEDCPIIGRQGALCGNVCFATGKYYATEHAVVVRNKGFYNPRFLYYLLVTANLNQYKTAGAQPGLSVSKLSNIKLPLPPLTIQEEIVKILDAFTNYKAELEAELEARKEQYEYYRNQLLTFDKENEKVLWTTLGDIAYYPKERISRDFLTVENYVSVENLLKDKQGKTNLSDFPQIDTAIRYQKDDILIGNIRPYLQKIWLADREGGTNGDVLTIRLKTKEGIMPRYLYFILASNDFFAYDMQFAKGAKMPRGDKQKVLEYPIPIPSISEQERIVAILDKFEALVNDLTHGLPAEIAAVQEQYEYYRNKLLTFKPKEVC